MLLHMGISVAVGERIPMITLIEIWFFEWDVTGYNVDSPRYATGASRAT